MKKIISITMAIMLLLSSLFITTAFAKTASADEVVINPDESASSDEVTTYPAIPNDPTTPGLDAETELEIKQAVADKYSFAEYGLTTDDVTLEYFGTLSDGSILIRYRFTGMSIIAVIIEDIIGNYEYIVDAAQQVDLYKNGTIYTIKDAYDTGVIADNVLDEIAKILNFTSANKQTEPTVPNVTDETNPQTTPNETKSQSTPDTVGNNKNNNSPIQTGQNASSALAATGIVTLLAADALLALKRRRV